MTDWTTINAAGSTVISFLTLIASAYLLISLTLQGRGKLRVRLLLGLVTSDLVIASVAFCIPHPVTPQPAPHRPPQLSELLFPLSGPLLPPLSRAGLTVRSRNRVAVLPTEIAFLAGHPVQTGTAACVSRALSILVYREEAKHRNSQNAGGFFVTAILFTQHLWTLTIAVATFLLLVRPRSHPLAFHVQWTALTVRKTRNTPSRMSPHCLKSIPGPSRRLFGASPSSTLAVSFAHTIALRLFVSLELTQWGPYSLASQGRLVVIRQPMLLWQQTHP